MSKASKSENWSGCPVRFGMSIFGDKWTLLIIRDLMFKGKHYYGDFLDSGEGISTNILANRLQKLEKNELVSKQEDPKNRSKYIYRLSEKGIDLLPLMLAMVDWAYRYDTKTEVPEEFINSLRSDPAEFQESLRSDLRNY